MYDCRFAVVCHILRRDFITVDSIGIFHRFAVFGFQELGELLFVFFSFSGSSLSASLT